MPVKSGSRLRFHVRASVVIGRERTGHGMRVPVNLMTASILYSHALHRLLRIQKYLDNGQGAMLTQASNDKV